VVDTSIFEEVAMKGTWTWLCLAIVAACARGEDNSVGSDGAEIGITLAGAPANASCISFKLESEDGTTQTYPFATNPGPLRIRNLAVGAYNLSALAYPAPVPPPVVDSDCAAVPLNAPWATEAPVAVVISPRTVTPITVTLVETGRIAITTTF